VFALPAGYFLTYIGVSEPLGARGVWIGMIIGLSIFSMLAALRLRFIMKVSLRQL